MARTLSDMTRDAMFAVEADAETAKQQADEMRVFKAMAANGAVMNLMAQVEALQVELRQRGESATQMQATIDRLQQQNSSLSSLAQSHQQDAAKHSAAAEAARAASDEHKTARHQAELQAQRERELRIVAESKPAQIIREPAQVIRVPAGPPPSATGTVAPAVLPNPPAKARKLNVHINGRDPNGFPSDYIITRMEN